LATQSTGSILWWEARRLAFNLALAVVGCLTIFVVYAVGEPLTKPGDDLVEPVLLIAGVLAYGLCANACYTLGWIAELHWAKQDGARRYWLRKRAFWLGLAGSALLTISPAILLPLSWKLLGFTSG
jgi:hypothetical protein